MAALEKFEDLPITQQQVNKEEYDLTLIRKASILSNDQYNEGLLQSPNYTRANDADTITYLIYTVCLRYFEALNYVSEKKISTVKLDAVPTAMKKGNFGGINITDDHMKSYTRLANQVGNALTGAYRLKKLREHVREGNAPLQTMLSKLNEIVSENYILNIDKERENLRALYFDFSKDSNATEYEKKNIAHEYYIALRKLSNIEKQLQIYSKTVMAIMKVHQLLYDHLDKIRTDELRKALAEYGTMLSAQMIVFNKLKT